MYRQPSTILQNSTPKRAGQTPKASLQKRSIMEHSPGLPQNTKSLRSCSVDRAKMLLKCQLGIKCHSQYNKVIRLLQYSSANIIVKGSDWGCIVRDLETIYSLGLTGIQFHSPKVTSLTNHAKITEQGLCYCNSNDWDGTTSVKVQSSA